MNNRLKAWLLGLFVAFLLPLSLFSQNFNAADSTGLPGDHFSLEGALELFKQAASPEDFEKLLNTESNYVNNLDLNEDGQIDYIRVVDHMDGDVHAIVLQASINAQESQDIAVIEIEKQGPESAILQIVGDEDIYGEQRIVEPYEEEAEGNGRGPFEEMTFYRVVVNVYSWRGVRFVYRPSYKVWVSPFRWAFYPKWWKPWRPHPWRHYHTRHVHYKRAYHVVPTHRVVEAHKVYVPRRKTSTIVRTRTTTRVAVKGNRGNVKAAKTTRTTTVRGRNGHVKASKTTTTAGVRDKNGRVVGSKTTTRAGVKMKKGAATRKTTSANVARNGKRGKAVGKKKTTAVKRKKKR